MPSRRDIFTNRAYYHIYNKTIDNIKIFNSHLFAMRFIELLSYYRSSKIKLRYSKFLLLGTKQKNIIKSAQEINDCFTVDIVAYCLMPNHFHILLRQKENGGIVQIIVKSLNALTRYYNLMNHRKGPIFLTQFRSKRLLTREQYLHVSRYIHLNPYSSGLVDSYDKLCRYPYSSFKSYLNIKVDKNDMLTKRLLLSNFKDIKTYQKFVFDHADYQKSMKGLKYAQKWFSV